ncbi:MAG: hypothetical protein CEE42_03205 [Promethearchaeota archaeon Loki_b31]|nr:MAG: hypothetical protein CEE42_03205 [Candidatus Lokiarchaeota archaeon Loki_b31]
MNIEKYLNLPLPLIPVMTTNLFLGITTSMFFKLFCLAPFIIIESTIMFAPINLQFIIKEKFHAFI